MTVCNLHWPGALAPHWPGARVKQTHVVRPTYSEREVERAMPFVPVEDCVQVQIEGRLDGQTTINDLYFRSTTGPRGAADVVALATAVKTWYVAEMTAKLNVAWLGRQVKARGLTNAAGFVTEVTLLGSNGATTGECLPNNVAMAVAFRTGLAGRSNHGRNYVPALSDTIVDGNNIDADWATSVVDAYFQLVFPGPYLPGGWVWVVVSRVLNNEPRVTGVFHEVLTVQVTDLIVDSMRTRLPGRGN